MALIRRSAEISIRISTGTVAAAHPFTAAQSGKVSCGSPRPAWCGERAGHDDHAGISPLCVPKISSALISCRNHLTSVNHVRSILLHPGCLGLAIQVEEPA